MATKSKTAFPSFPLIVISTTLLLCLAYFLFRSSVQVAQVTNIPGQAPITGTFFLSDITLTYAQMEQMVDEWKAMGMDTVVILGSGDIKKVGTTYQENNWFTQPHPYQDLIKIAANRNMKLYVGLAYLENINIYAPADDPSSDTGHAIDFSKRLASSLKSFCTAHNIPWASIAGFYIPSEVVLPGPWPYHQALATAIKSVAPDKRVMISPYMGTYSENTAYRVGNNTGKIIFQESNIDIIALQDSLGTGKVTNILSAKAVYRGLSDALVGAPPGKEVWANIETFEKPIGSPDYYPATFTRVREQIETWRPYVSKNITWIYQHDFQLNPPIFNNAGQSWNTEYSYTAANAAKRAALRTAYMNAYGIQANLASPPPSPSPSPSIPPSPSPSITPSPTPSPTPVTKPGDFNLDTHVNAIDYSLFVAGFPTKYSIFDYALLITNYGK